MRSSFFLDTLPREVRYAVRGFGKDRRFVATAIIALALGIGSSTVVFSVFYNLLFNALTAKNADRLVVPVIEDAEKPNDAQPLWVSLLDVEYLQKQSQVFDGVIGRHYGRSLVQEGARTFQFYNAMLTANAFEVYSTAPILGRGIVSQDGKAGAPKVLVMSYTVWKEEFGSDPAVIGKSLVVEGEPRTTVGVMPKGFRGFGSWDIYTPVNWTPSIEKTGNAPKYNVVMARLKKGVTTAAASAEFGVLAKQLAALHAQDNDYPKRFTARVIGANDYLMGASGAGQAFHTKIDLKTILYDLLAATLVLLLIACSNVANLLLARATARQREVAIRAALGASRRQIVRQLLVESLCLAAAAAIGGCLLAWMAMKMVDAAMHQEAWEGMRGEAVIGLNIPVLIFTVAITLGTTLICGIVPALRVTKRDVQPQLIGSARGTTGVLHKEIRAGLVVGQVALSIVLLVGAGLMVRSLYKLTHVDLGFNPKNVLVIAMAPSRSSDQLPDRALMASVEGRARFQRVIEKIKELPGVASVAVDNTIPGYGPFTGPNVTVPGGTRTEMAGLDECDENCADTLGMRLVVGRWLSREEALTRQYATVLTETLARDLFGNQNPIGKQLEVKDFDRWKNHSRTSNRMTPEQTPHDALFQVVGVVADVKNAGPQQPAVPMAFIPPILTGEFILQVRTKLEPTSMLHTVQDQVWAMDPNEVFWIVGTAEEFLLEYTYRTPEFGVSLSAPIAGIALLLVVVGVFSVTAYTVSLRTQEIGVRMALGAQQSDVLRMVLRHGFALIAAGLVIGLLASVGLTRFLASQIWGVSATDPWTFGIVALLLVLAGLVACYLPARRATEVDPLVALRYE
jgi:putative ABC transport system permease protein